MLDLTGCKQISSHGYQLIATSFPFLTSLSLAETSVTDNDIEVLSFGCSEMVNSVFMTKVTNNYLNIPIFFMFYYLINFFYDIF